MATALTTDRLDFELPTALEASEPPEARGLRRDGVRMLVARVASGALASSTFSRLGEFLEPGDLVVVNTSATIPAALDASAADGTRFAVHLSTRLDDDRWVVEPRQLTGASTRALARRGSLAVACCCAARRRWSSSIPTARAAGSGSPGWTSARTPSRGSRPTADRSSTATRARPWPLEAYQNVYATEPGSAEMPSAGRPFTTELLTHLVADGVRIAPIVLHTGVSSLEADELPYPERVTRAGDDGEPRELDAARGRTGRRRRHDGRPRARDRPPATTASSDRSRAGPTSSSPPSDPCSSSTACSRGGTSPCRRTC